MGSKLVDRHGVVMHGDHVSFFIPTIELSGSRSENFIRHLPVLSDREIRSDVHVPQNNLAKTSVLLGIMKNRYVLFHCPNLENLRRVSSIKDRLTFSHANTESAKAVEMDPNSG